MKKNNKIKKNKISLKSSLNEIEIISNLDYNKEEREKRFFYNK